MFLDCGEKNTQTKGENVNFLQKGPQFNRQTKSCSEVKFIAGGPATPAGMSPYFYSVNCLKPVKVLNMSFIKLIYFWRNRHTCFRGVSQNKSGQTAQVGGT